MERLTKQIDTVGKEMASQLSDRVEMQPPPEAPASDPPNAPVVEVDVRDADEGFVTDPAVAPKQAAEQPGAADASQAFQATTVESKTVETEDAVDLYAIGAVDYEPNNVVHNT